MATYALTVPNTTAMVPAPKPNISIITLLAFVGVSRILNLSAFSACLTHVFQSPIFIKYSPQSSSLILV